MTPGSLPPLSPKVRALLEAEREISPQPEFLRRRAALRARTVLWHARGAAELPRGRSALGTWWRRGSLAAVALLGATSAFAAWIVLEPADSPGVRATLVTSPSERPPVERVPVAATPSDATERRSPTASTAEEPDSSLAQRAPVVGPGARRQTPAPNAAKSPTSTSEGTPRSAQAVAANQRGTAAEELAILDSARRAVAAGNFRAALQAVDRHARSFPASQLREEREALRVKALAGAGLSKQAGRAARDFESSYPKSVLVPELQKSDRTTP